MIRELPFWYYSVSNDGCPGAVQRFFYIFIFITEHRRVQDVGRGEANFCVCVCVRSFVFRAGKLLLILSTPPSVRIGWDGI